MDALTEEGVGGQATLACKWEQKLTIRVGMQARPDTGRSQLFKRLQRLLTASPVHDPSMSPGSADVRTGRIGVGRRGQIQQRRP